MPVKNELLTHAITQIENITQDIAASYGINPQSRFLRDASMDRVSQQKLTIKEKIEQRDAEYLELAKDPDKNEARLRKMVDEAAADANMYRRNAGEELNIYIPDGVMKSDGSAVSFTDLILDGEKLGETRGLNTHFLASPRRRPGTASDVSGRRGRRPLQTEPRFPFLRVGADVSAARLAFPSRGRLFPPCPLVS